MQSCSFLAESTGASGAPPLPERKISMRKPLLPALVLIASAGMLALTGCSGAAEPGPTQTRSSTSQQAASETTTTTAEGQTVEAACAIANEHVLSLQDEGTAAPTNHPDQTDGAARPERTRVGTEWVRKCKTRRS